MEGTNPTTKADVQSLVVRSLPTPDETTSFEQILDFRSDPSTRQQLVRLRRWIRKTTQSDPTALDIIRELEYLLGEYQEHREHHKMKTKKGILQVLLTTTAEIAGDFVKLKWGKLAIKTDCHSPEEGGY